MKPAWCRRACTILTMTIHSLLGLKPKQNEEDTVLIRSGPSQAKRFRAVVIDEASMVSSGLYDFDDDHPFSSRSQAKAERRRYGPDTQRTVAGQTVPRC